MNSTNVQIVFSEPLEIASAANPANYVFTNGLAVTRAALADDSFTVTLTTAPLVDGSNYWLVLNGIRDRASTPNTIAANTRVAVFAGLFTPQDIGAPTPPGFVLGARDGFDVGGGGADVGGSSDQFQFAYATRSGDFDIKVRLQSLSQTSSFAKAGLMAREDLSLGSRFAGVFATPAMNGSFFEWRDPAASTARSSGSFPVNYPDDLAAAEHAAAAPSPVLPVTMGPLGHCLAVLPFLSPTKSSSASPSAVTFRARK